MEITPELLISLVFLLLGCAIVGAMVWLERRPKASLETRLVPTTPLMFAGLIVVLLATVHLVNLLGIHTGR